jgi:hypothetical protein
MQAIGQFLDEQKEKSSTLPNTVLSKIGTNRPFLSLTETLATMSTNRSFLAFKEFCASQVWVGTSRSTRAGSTGVFAFDASNVVRILAMPSWDLSTVTFRAGTLGAVVSHANFPISLQRVNMVQLRRVISDGNQAACAATSQSIR